MAAFIYNQSEANNVTSAPLSNADDDSNRSCMALHPLLRMESILMSQTFTRDEYLYFEARLWFYMPDTVYLDGRSLDDYEKAIRLTLLDIPNSAIAEQIRMDYNLPA